MSINPASSVLHWGRTEFATVVDPVSAETSVEDLHGTDRQPATAPCHRHSIVHRGCRARPRTLPQLGRRRSHRSRPTAGWARGIGGVRPWPFRHVERGNAGVDEARSMHGHPVGNLLGFRRHGDAWSFGSFAVAATAAGHCKNKSRDCHTHYRMSNVSAPFSPSRGSAPFELHYCISPTPRDASFDKCGKRTECA